MYFILLFISRCFIFLHNECPVLCQQRPRNSLVGKIKKHEIKWVGGDRIVKYIIEVCFKKLIFNVFLGDMCSKKYRKTKNNTIICTSFWYKWQFSYVHWFAICSQYTWGKYKQTTEIIIWLLKEISTLKIF